MIHEFKLPHQINALRRRSGASLAVLRKASGPESSSAYTLRQRVGNQGIQRLIVHSKKISQTESPAIQTKLAVSQPGDIHEREADRVADAVMRMPEPAASQTPPTSMTASAADVQRRCTNCEEEHASANLGTKETEESGSRIRRKEISPGGAPAGQEKAPLNFQSKGVSSGGSGTPAPPIVHEVLSSPGQPLGAKERAFMEPRFGQDFSGVRVHTDTKAAQSADAVHARAYTAGNNIVFGGKESTSNLPVLAHELAHVVQQSGGPPAVQRLTYCRDFLEQRERPGVREHNVRDHLAIDATLFGKVVKELPIPEGSAAAKRTERRDRQIPPYIAGESGFVDVALLMGSRLEILEVKKATWESDGAEFAEGQLEKYLRKGRENRDIVTQNWRKKREKIEGKSPNDVVTSVDPMPMERLPLLPNPRLIGGVPVLLRWCDDGLIVFKLEPPKDKKPEDKKPKDKKPKDKDPGPSDILPELLKKLGQELAPWLARAGLFDIGLALARVMLAWVSAPLAALAAVVLGIAFFWDEIKAVASKIAGVAQAVWDKIAGLASWVRGAFTSILGKLHELGIKLGELGSFLAGKIASLAKKLAEGAAWVARKIGAGAKWVAGKIASGAEAFWDWLWGSDVQPIYPIIDIPITEEPRHCRTVAYEDSIVRLDADLLFPINEWVLLPGADAHLKVAAKKIASMLRKDDWVRFEGYADIVGGTEYNQRLSERRADAVRSWFVANGVVPMPRTRIEGYGKKMARAKVNDEEGRRRDRRVDIWLPKSGGTRRWCQ
jgi:outer membrane protein OmpA-like peptidoglycan-associated protein